MRQALIDYNPQMEAFEYDFESESNQGEAEVFNESQQLELASELLEVRNEAQLEQFLGDLIKQGGAALGKAVTSQVGQSIGGLLKSAAKQALPAAGAALGGSQLGRGLAQLAGSAFGLELEGLSHEDQEFEAARQFVRLAGETVRNATANEPNPTSALAPRKDALTAFQTAARKHAPGFASGAANSGLWQRQGRNILILDIY